MTEYRIEAMNNPTGQRVDCRAEFPAGELEVKSHTCNYDEKARCYRVVIEFGRPGPQEGVRRKIMELLDD